MAIPKAVHVDPIDVSTLRGPLLDEYYGSAIQRQDVMKVAEEIMRRHLAKIPNKTGNLRSTARVTAHRSKEHRDRRYEAEYSIGGPRADYIVPLEDEHHYLDQVLREMGFYTGDIVSGPTGRVPETEKAPAARVAAAEQEAGIRTGEQGSTTAEYNRISELVDQFQRPGRRVGSTAYDTDYDRLSNRLQEIQAEIAAERGREEALKATKLGWTALASYREMRRSKGMTPHPGDHGALTHEMMEERRASRGGHTWEMSKLGIPDPDQMLSMRPEPLTDFFSDEELRGYGRDPDAIRAEHQEQLRSRGFED